MPQERSDLSSTEASGRLVAFFIVLTFILFFAAASVIAYHWFTTSEPNSVLIIQASHPLAGARVQVKGIDFPVEYDSVIGEGDRYTLPFYLDAGSYTLRITKDDKTLIDREINLHPRGGLRLNLTELEPKVPTTQATSS